MIVSCTALGKGSLRHTAESTSEAPLANPHAFCLLLLWMIPRSSHQSSGVQDEDETIAGFPLVGYLTVH